MKRPEWALEPRFLTEQQARYLLRVYREHAFECRDRSSWWWITKRTKGNNIFNARLYEFLAIEIRNVFFSGGFPK